MSEQDVADLVKHLSVSLVATGIAQQSTDPRSLLLTALEDWRDNDSTSERAENVGAFLADSDCVLLGFHLISFQEVPVGSLMAPPPRPVLRDFLSIAGVVLAARPKDRALIQQTKMKPGNVRWVHRRYLVREFEGNE